MPRKKKSNTKKSKASLEEMNQTHGMEQKPKPTTLAQIWGDDGMSRYGTMNEVEYDSFLNNSSKSDLQAHANKVGLLPIDNVLILKERLKREFVAHVAKYNAPQEIKQNPVSSESMRILSEGK